MSGRARQVLLRFPAHLDAARPGKQLGAVVDALTADLDRLAADLAAVRRAHRLGDADTLVDLLLLAGLHGLSRADLDVLFAGAARKRALLAHLETALAATPPAAAARDAAAGALLDLWGIDAANPRLPLFAPPRKGGGAPDLDAAARALAAAAGASLGYRATVQAARARVARICQLHAGGNGTVSALLQAAANALDLEIVTLVHSSDLFWHAGFVRDRAPLLPGAPVALEALGMEENPRHRESFPPGGDAGAPEEVVDGQLFQVTRRGFGREPLQVAVVGVANRTVGPMIVNRDEGHGVGFSAAVPAGKALVFQEGGRVLLDGADVTSLAFSWQGACFAGAADPHGQPADPHDFVFAGTGVAPGRRALFAVATPAGALDREFTFPHAGLDVAVPGIGIGVTRLAFFAQVAHLGSRVGTALPPAVPAVRAVSPRPFVAFADGAVFAATPGAAAGSPFAPAKAADLHLSWMEHEAYAVRVIIPKRFGLLDAGGPPTPGNPAIADRVAAALARFRPAGVDVRVELADDAWKLGQGAVGGAAPLDPISMLQGGTVLSPSPHPPT